jgi:hypothetical protein
MKRAAIAIAAGLACGVSYAGVSGAPAGYGHAGHMPEIDTATVPERATPLTAPKWRDANAALYGERPAADVQGALRFTCKFSHTAWDDPLVKPNIPGGSHGHTFVGNAGVTAHTTADDLRGPGSTCAGGSVNQSAYWMPLMVDTANGAVVKPSGALMYYKCGYGLTSAECLNIKAPPPGFSMIAGNMANTELAGPYEFKCNGNLPSYKTIPDCAAGSTLWMIVAFPQCVAVDPDGYPLRDSADHKSHVTKPSGGKCPATHPYAIPEITQVFQYKVLEAGEALRWRLSSDQTGAPAGTSAHADYWNGWGQAELEAAIAACTAGGFNCHTNLLPPLPGTTTWRYLLH